MNSRLNLSKNFLPTLHKNHLLNMGRGGLPYALCFFVLNSLREIAHFTSPLVWVFLG